MTSSVPGRSTVNVKPVRSAKSRACFSRSPRLASSDMPSTAASPRTEAGRRADVRDARRPRARGRTRCAARRAARAWNSGTSSSRGGSKSSGTNGSALTAVDYFHAERSGAGNRLSPRFARPASRAYAAMFVSIRRYFVHAPAKELRTRRSGLADRISAQPDSSHTSSSTEAEGEALTISASTSGSGRGLERSHASGGRGAGRLRTDDVEQCTGRSKLMHATAARPPSAHPALTTGFAASGAPGSPRIGRGHRRAREEFARQLETLPDSYAYQVIDCGDGDIIAVESLPGRASAAPSDELAERFVGSELQVDSSATSGSPRA